MGERPRGAPYLSTANPDGLPAMDSGPEALLVEKREGVGTQPGAALTSDSLG